MSPNNAKIDRMVEAFKRASALHADETERGYQAWRARARMFPSSESLPEDRSWVSPLGGQAVEAGAKPKTQGAKPKASWW